MIRYYIHSDGDDPTHPNIFHIPNAGSQVSLRDVRQNFPLPGTYHFRFKKRMGENKFVWLDVVEDNAEVPSFEGGIIAKVTRISMDVPKPTAAGNNGPSRSSQRAPVSEANVATSPPTSGYEDTTTADLLNMGGSPSRSPPVSGSASKPQAPPKNQHSDSDPFGLFSDHDPVQSTPVQSQPSRSSTSSAAPDLLNFDSFGGRPMPSQQQPPMGRGPPPRGPPMQPNVRPFQQNPNSGWSAF